MTQYTIKNTSDAMKQTFELPRRFSILAQAIIIRRNTKKNTYRKHVHSITHLIFILTENYKAFSVIRARLNPLLRVILLFLVSQKYCRTKRLSRQYYEIALL